MPRPTNKTELIAAASEQWNKMWSLIASMPPALRDAEFRFGNDPKLKEAHWPRDKNLRDVLVHLYEWHSLLLRWVESNLRGEPLPFLPAPHTWKSYGDMNVEFGEKHQGTSYVQAEALLRESHAQAMALIESLSDAELFEKQHYPWTGSTSVGAYCISATASHYDWAVKKIKLHLKTGGTT
ncbi:MAG: ClbS/DfsB family four-helix bundle protein [Clostridiales bacterium]|nr:ClbS/DfsB family four-helix bundle protein [Clostridiales bacterium]